MTATRPALPARRPGGAFEPLTVPAFRLLLLNVLIFIGAVTGQTVARSWVALEEGGSNTILGAVQLTWGVAMLLGIPLGGVAADRASRRAVVLWSVLAVAVTSLVVALAVVVDQHVLASLYASAAVQGLAFAFFSPARLAMTAELVGPNLATRAVALSQVGYSVMLAAGPALAGVFVAWPRSGAAGVFVVSGLLCAVAGLSMLALPVGRTKEGAKPSGLGLVEVGRHIRDTPPLGLLVGTSGVVVLAGFPFVTFMPTVAAELGGGAAVFGALSALVAVGSLVVGILIAQFARSRRALLWSFRLSGLVLGAALIALGGAGHLYVAMAVLVVAGGAMLGFQASTQALVMQVGERLFHGRLQALLLLGYTASSLVALPLGMVADEVGVRLMLACTGLVVLGAAVVAGIALRNR